jgi:hypothetical protein
LARALAEPREQRAEAVEQSWRLAELVETPMKKAGGDPAFCQVDRTSGPASFSSGDSLELLGFLDFLTFE